jgi:hypothetical protein
MHIVINFTVHFREGYANPSHRDMQNRTMLPTVVHFEKPLRALRYYAARSVI